MATLISLPEVLQSRISNFLRPHKLTGGHVDQVSSAVAPPKMKIDPFSKTRDIATIKAVHHNLNGILLWKNCEWTEHICQWRDENLTKMRWKYQYGVLPDKMIKNGWVNKINNDYRHQDCYVETIFGTEVGTGFALVPKEYKVIWFDVSLFDLLAGVRPLPHCFGSDALNTWRSEGGTLQLSKNFVPAPSLETMIPKNKRREWLIHCFKECVLQHWGEKSIDRGAGVQPDFIKEFKNMMGLSPHYELSQTCLFRMFLKEVGVRPRSYYCRDKQPTLATDSIFALCQKPLL